MATTDIRLDCVKHEYVGLRDAQDALIDRIDGYEAALLGLTEAVAANKDLIMKNHEMIMENRDLIMANRQELRQLNEKMDEVMKHLDVPPKPPAGFVKE